MPKRLLTALTVLLLLAGFVSACGDDDDDDTAAATDDTEETVPAEQAEVDDAKAAFCADLNDDTGEETPVEDVQASIDTAIAAQTAAETPEQTDALQLLADFGTAVIDGDDGDGVITTAEVSAGAADFPTLEDALGELSAWCTAPSRGRVTGGGASNTAGLEWI